jgi:pimeloyl-ACP methyl ester carboxylesterase
MPDAFNRRERKMRLRRRQLLTLGTGAGLSLMAGHNAAAAACAEPQMSGEKATFVLVHGAFHGAWCWKHVRDQLRHAGHDVYTPTLTGLGERAHLVNPGIDLETHIRDVSQVIEVEELADVILVGHSYAGYVVAGVADRLSRKIKRLIYLDVFLPVTGTDFFSNIPPPQLQEVMSSLVEGYLVPAFSPEKFGVLPVESEEWRWVKRRLTPQPVATFQTVLTLSDAIDDVQKTYIRCAPDMAPEADPVHLTIKDSPGWRYRQLATTHDAMVLAPQALALLLLEESAA